MKNIIGKQKWIALLGTHPHANGRVVKNDHFHVRGVMQTDARDHFWTSDMRPTVGDALTTHITN